MTAPDAKERNAGEMTAKEVKKMLRHMANATTSDAAFQWESLITQKVEWLGEQLDAARRALGDG